MNLSELNPFPVFAFWEGEAIELKPFSLRSVTWAERFFFTGEENGFDLMQQMLSNKDDKRSLFNTVVDVVYHLGVEDFESVGVSCPVRLKELLNKQENPLEILTEFRNALQQVFTNSFSPKIKQTEIKGGEIHKNMAKGEKLSENETKWEQIYISFYMAGGMSLDEFYNLTMRQIDNLYPEINYKLSEDFSKQAELHNRKLKNKPRRKQQVEQKTAFTNEDIAAFEKMQEDLMKKNKAP